ncbi:hypothetical protein V8E36_000916 [Tilletia maclaganii]
MGLAGTVYQSIFKRNSIYVGSVFAGAFGFAIGFDVITSKWWDSHNRGKQWKDIRSKYVEES